MTQTQDIAWVAGLLEGEGYFGNRASTKEHNANSIRVTLGMTDRDVIERAAEVLHGNVIGPYAKSNSKYKPMYYVQWHGARAAGIMMTVYSFMGKRRQEKIKEILKLWKADKRRPLSPRP